MSRLLSLCALLLTLVAVPGARAQSSKDAIQVLLSAQEAAWNRGDGPVWAAAFTPDADFINIRGDIFHGRAEIAQRHARIFAGPYLGSHVAVTIRRFTEVVPGVAVVETDQEVTHFRVLPPGVAATTDGVLQTHMKYVATKQADSWQFVAAQNTAVLPALSPPH